MPTSSINTIFMEMNPWKFGQKQSTSHKYIHQITIHQVLAIHTYENCVQMTVNFFTYVTKTGLNLTTYTKKPGNNNGTIIFEIDIMKKSYPVNLKFTSLPLSKPKWHFFSGAVSWCSQLCCSVNKNKTKTFVKKSSLTKILIDSVRLFHNINLKNNDAIVIPRFSTVCG